MLTRYNLILPLFYVIAHTLLSIFGYKKVFAFYVTYLYNPFSVGKERNLFATLLNARNR